MRGDAMEALTMQPDLQDVPPLHVAYVEGGALLHSFALRDVGVDTLFDLPELETAYRAKLGDMCFVVRVRPDRSVSHLYFVPEYPNNNLGLKERITSYYALPVFGSTAELCELRANDSSLRIIDWEAGVSQVAPLGETAIGNAKRTIDRILQINSLLKRLGPNLSSNEMRQSVGPASGARFTGSAFLVGDVA